METYTTQPNIDFGDKVLMKELFNKNIYSALQSAMSIKTDDMSEKDFKNLVQFILNVKCKLI